MLSFPDGYKLPRQIDLGPDAQGIVAELQSHTLRLHERARMEVPLLDFSEALQHVLTAAHRTGRLVRGLEAAEIILKREQKGLQKVGLGVPQERISRLLLMADDGSRHFYRKADRLLERHAPRVLGCMVSADGEDLGRLLFGPGKNVRLVLISHKEAVCSFLTALVR